MQDVTRQRTDRLFAAFGKNYDIAKVCQPGCGLTITRRLVRVILGLAKAIAKYRVHGAEPVEIAIDDAAYSYFSLLVGHGGGLLPRAGQPMPSAAL